MMTCYKMTMSCGKTMTVLDQEGSDINQVWKMMINHFGQGRVIRIVDMNRPSDILCQKSEVICNDLDA